ncbi:MAG: hypothetical protein JRI45_06510 [Deltaproteobacteria bacterium]|nr:hypothetical protein [Deltaproteobacteria bacterium]MBW2067816.1 hypothetical protein [Deltaproteobacteria bacterium]
MDALKKINPYKPTSLLDVEVNELKEDPFFDISRHRRIHVFEHLSRTEGILCPLWTYGSKTVTVVDGYNRLRWAREQGLGHVQCLVFPEDADKCYLLLQKVVASAGFRKFDIFEKANVVKNLSRCLTPDEIKRRIFPILGIPAKPRMLKTLLKIASMPLDEIVVTLEGGVSERTLMKLAWWNEESRACACKLFAKLRCSTNIQLEITEMIEDISRLEETSPADVIDHESIRQVIEDDLLTQRQKTEAVRRLLKQWLFPHLSEVEARFLEAKKQWKLPSGVRIEPPPFFEGDLWQITLSFSNAQELKDQLEKLAKSEIASQLEVFLGKDESSHKIT